MEMIDVNETIQIRNTTVNSLMDKTVYYIRLYSTNTYGSSVVTYISKFTTAGIVFAYHFLIIAIWLNSDLLLTPSMLLYSTVFRRKYVERHHMVLLITCINLYFIMQFCLVSVTVDIRL